MTSHTVRAVCSHPRLCPGQHKYNLSAPHGGACSLVNIAIAESLTTVLISVKAAMVRAVAASHPTAGSLMRIEQEAMELPRLLTTNDDAGCDLDYTCGVAVAGCSWPATREEAWVCPCRYAFDNCQHINRRIAPPEPQYWLSLLRLG